MIEENELTTFFSGLETAVEMGAKAQKRMDRKAATKFCGFGFFRSASNVQIREIHLSRIFADLLNPQGTHGQGDRFLSLLLEELKSTLPEDFSPGDLPGATVHLEYSTDERRRIDILLEMSGNHWIGIENKPWAEEGERQVIDYWEFLQKKIRNVEAAKMQILYLSGDGSPPSLPEKKLESPPITVPYRKNRNESSVEGWIEQCWRECEAERVRWFLQELLEYIRRELDKEGQTMGQDVIDDTTVEFILRDRNPTLAFKVEKAMPQVRHRLILEVKKRLEGWSKGNDAEVSTHCDKGLVAGLRLRKEKWPTRNGQDKDWGLSVIFLHDMIKIELPVDTCVAEFKRKFEDRISEPTRKFYYQGLPLIEQSFSLLPEESLTKNEIAARLACKMTTWAKEVDTVTGDRGLGQTSASV